MACRSAQQPADVGAGWPARYITMRMFTIVKVREELRPMDQTRLV